MTLRRTLLGLLLASAVAVTAPAPVAQATSLAPLTTEQLTDASTYIVRGTLVDVWTEVDDNGYIWTRTLVEVQHTFKGPDRPETLVVDSLGGSVGERRMMVPATARFSEGEDVLLFLAEVDHGRRLTPVGMSTGKYTIRRAPNDTRQHVVRYTRDSEDAYDHRFLPFPKPEARVYLDEVESAVEARLDTGWDGQPVPGISPERLRDINTVDRRFRR